MEFTKDTVLNAIVREPLFRSAQGQLIAAYTDYFAGEIGELTLGQLQEKNPTWNHKDMIIGLKRLQDVAKAGIDYVLPVYAPEEIAADPRKGSVKLLYLPAPKPVTRTFVLLMAGGGYGAVCTMGEALPVAARLNELGVSCFCLNYRTAAPVDFDEGLMPKPLEDVTAACRYIRSHSEALGVNPDSYLAGGFSAGGHLAGMWGTAHLGARHYGLPNPKALLLAYPMVTLENFDPSPVVDYITLGMFGKGHSKEHIHSYAVNRHVDKDYPAVYLVQSRDDDTVPIKHAEDLMLALEQAHVAHTAELVATGGHGFGLGTATPAKGWVARSVQRFLYLDRS